MATLNADKADSFEGDTRKEILKMLARDHRQDVIFAPEESAQRLIIEYDEHIEYKPEVMSIKI